MASGTHSSPLPHHDPALELAALRAKCTRLQTERDKFKEALWTLRGNFSALQTHAETLELENGDLKDVLSMRGEPWGGNGAITLPPAQGRLRSPSAAIPDNAASSSTTLTLAPPPEPTEQPLPALPKPIMRMQQFVEGSSSSAPSNTPSPAALTVGSMGPPPTPGPHSILQFQQGHFVEGSHSANLPRSRTLAPVGSPSSYKKSGGASGKRKTTAKPKSTSVGSSGLRQTRSTKRVFEEEEEEEAPSPSVERTSPKKPRTESAPQGFRSVAGLPEDTDLTLRAHFDSVLTPSISSISGQPQESISTDAGQSSSRQLPVGGLGPMEANLTHPARYTPEPQFLSPVQQASPPLTQEEDPAPRGHEQESAMQIDPEPHQPAAEWVELGAKGSQLLPEQRPNPTQEIAPVVIPAADENDEDVEPEPALDTPAIPTSLAGPVSDTDTRSEITVKPRAPATVQTSTRPSLAASPAPSTTSTRVTRSSRPRGEDLSNGKPRRVKTSWDPTTGQRIQVGPPRGKPKSIQAAPAAVKKEPKGSRRLVISIRPRAARTSSAMGK